MNTKAQWESLISSFIMVVAADTGTEFDKNDPDVRGQVKRMLDDAKDAMQIDETAWPQVKTKYLYDVYLQMRTEEGTVTQTDLTRAGLSPGLFSTTDEWHRHCARVIEGQSQDGLDSVKTCSACGQTKHVSKFKKHGGSRCGACQAKAYRERRAAK
jgi:hypothetical protein